MLVIMNNLIFSRSFSKHINYRMFISILEYHMAIKNYIFRFFKNIGKECIV